MQTGKGRTVRLVTTILTICLLRLSTATAQVASPGVALPAGAADESDWCAEHRKSLAARRATLIAQEPELKAGMAAAFARLKSDVNKFADRATELKKRVDDMKSTADDLANWWKFRRLFEDAGKRLQILGTGITAWDMDTVDSLGPRISKHEDLSYEIDEDEPLYKASCTDPPRGASVKEIVDALKDRGVKEPDVLLYINLATEFRTPSMWALAVVRERTSQYPEWDEYGPLFVCFLKDQSPDCRNSTGSPATINLKNDLNPYVLDEVHIVQASPNGKNPRLLIKTCTEPSGDGACGMYTTIFTYNKTSDRFDPMFQNATEGNRSARTRFIESGPMQSDIIVDYPGDDAPYTYWVEVHRPQSDGRYGQILKYRGKTGYGDGNPLAVIDSEMPEILRRLGLRKSGDPLPVPAKLPEGCTTLFMRNGVEWCK